MVRGALIGTSLSWIRSQGGQPSKLNMHFGIFWVWIYELPLMLRSEAMARKLGGILGVFEEMDQKEAHRIGRFLRVKVKIHLK